MDLKKLRFLASRITRLESVVMDANAQFMDEMFRSVTVIKDTMDVYWDNPDATKLDKPEAGDILETIEGALFLSTTIPRELFWDSYKLKGGSSLSVKVAATELFTPELLSKIIDQHRPPTRERSNAYIKVQDVKEGSDDITIQFELWYSFD